MGKSRDRANRSGADPVNIGAARLSLDSAASSDIKVTAQDGTTLKKVFAEELHVGTGNDRVILKRNSSDGKVQFQTTDGSTTETTQIGTGVVANPGDLPLTGNSAGDTKFVTSNNNLMIYNGTGWYKIATVTNSSPTISSAGNATYSFATDGTPIIVEITATDPEGLALQYKYQVTSGSLGSTATVTSSSTSGGTYSAINANTLTSNKYFKVTPSTNTAHAGTFSLTFSASDGVNVANSSASSFTLGFSTFGSIYFDGSGDSLVTPSSSDFVLGTGDFTIEYWLWPTDFSAVRIIIDRRLGSSGEDITMNHNTDGTIRWYANSSYRIISTAINAQEWTHIALVRNSGTATMYINGIAQSTTYSDSTNYTGQYVHIGKHYNNTSYDFYGYISNYREVKGTAVYTSDFTPAGPLAAITNTSLLTAHKNNEIVDGSSNNLTITKNGNVAAHASNPFSGNAAGYGSFSFDGTSDRVLVDTSTDVDVGTSDFTLEYWIYARNFDTVGTVFDMRNDGENVSMLSNITTSGEPRLYANAGYRITAGPRMNTKEWNHIAFQRASSVTKMYLNGIEQATTYADTNNYPGQRVIMGSERDTTTEFDGYVSNFRLVVGSNAYSPSAMSGWSGSIHMNGGTLSSTGIGGSYTMGTGDFTIETWFKYTASATLASNDYLFDLGTSNDIRITFGSGKINVDDGGQVFSYTISSVDTSLWYHLAYTRTGGISSLYLDGQLKASIGDSSYNHAESTFTLGNYGGGGSYVWSGYLTDFRIVKGKAVYTGNFTRPSGPLTKTGGTYPSSTNISNPTASQTVLLIGNNASSITDVSDTGHTLTPSGSISASSDVPTGTSFTVPTSPLTAITNTKLLTAPGAGGVRAGSGSAYFDGSGDYLLVPNTGTSTDIVLGQNNFAIEFWVYAKSFSNGGVIYDTRQNEAAGLMINFNTSGNLRLYSNSSYRITCNAISVGEWHHYAVVRSSGTTKVYLDGIADDETYSGGEDYAGNTVYIGKHNSNTGADFNGYISNLRLVVGTAVYTSNFAPPTTALTAITNTKLLTCQNSTGTITDASSINHTIGANGNATASSVAPINQGTDQSTFNHGVSFLGNTRYGRNWPFNYNG